MLPLRSKHVARDPLHCWSIVKVLPTAASNSKLFILAKQMHKQT